MSKIPTILLVDDDPATNFLNHRMLQQMNTGGEVLMARNGLEALDLLLSRWHQKDDITPALVLLDIDMPVMSGYEFLGLYGRLPADQRAAIVVAILSNSEINQDSVRTQQWPVTEFLAKPLTRENLTHLLQHHFGVVPT